MPTITFNSNGGTFPGGGTTNTYTFTRTTTYLGCSHTENVDDTGLKSSNYGNNWTNSNIRGTGRTSASSNAHVLTDPAAMSLEVLLYYNGESVSYDWVSVFDGSYPSYTASSYSSTGAVTQANNYVEGVSFSSNKFGGSQSGTYVVNGNTLTKMGYTKLNIPGNAVTFAFKSDGSVFGEGYGYYAIVNSKIESSSGQIIDPSRSGTSSLIYIFKNWNTNSDGTGTSYLDRDIETITSDTTLFAQYSIVNIATNPFYIENITTSSTTARIRKNIVSDITLPAIYKINSGSWTVYNDGDIVTIPAAGKCYWCADYSVNTNTNYFIFETSGTSSSKVNIGGDLSSLINCSTSATTYCFYNLFKNNINIVNASSLDFSKITTLANYCYFDMFYGCTGLTAVPEELPVTTLANSCYREMFYNCTNLTSVPELPATTLANNCYYYMFNGCTGLTAAPELPATTLAERCYYSMFEKCTGLTSAPVLPATTLADSCYYSMFEDCTGLTSAPELPATTLAQRCYQYMFYCCTGLTSAPELPATTLANSCYYSMFNGCTGLTSVPELPATTLANNCYYSMFQNCTSLITLPELPATTLTESCYRNMFQGCTGIRLSETQTGIYQWPYRIPKEGTGTTAIGALSDMFISTSGTFAGTPTINTTYYVPQVLPFVFVTYNNNNIYKSTSDLNITLPTVNKQMSDNIGITVTIENGNNIAY